MEDHLNECAPAFGHDGIHVVRTDDQIEVATELSAWSRREARWDFPLFSRSLVESTGTAYVLVHAGVPVAYAVFNTMEFSNGRGETSYVEDLFTFPHHRRKGFAMELLNYGLANLPWAPGFIGVSMPVRPEAKQLILTAAKASGASIMGVSSRGWWDMAIDEFEAMDAHH